MTTLPNLSIVLPTRGTAGSGHWADTLDSNYQLLDAHDHTAGKGLRIKSAALSIDGDVSFGSSWATIDMQRVSFSAVTALTSNNRSLFVSSSDNELYWRSNAGNNVKVTSGSALNVGAFVGGIGGDYTAVSAALNYDDAVKRYTFKQGGGTTWAKTQSGGLRLVEFGSSETVFVEQLCPAALAGSYTMTWPTALPGSQVLVQVDSAGQLAFSNSLAANASITLSGTGDLKHGDRTFSLSAVGGQQISGTMTRDSGGTVTSTSSATIGWMLPIRVGDRVKSVTFAGFGDGAVDATVELFKVTTTGGTSTYATTTVTNAPSGWNDFTATAGSPTALPSTDSIFLRISCGAGTFAITNIRLVYDRP